MATHHKKRPKLSAKMNLLKKEINNLTLQNTQQVQSVQVNTSIFTAVSGGISNFLHLLSTILSANKDIPVIGFMLQMISMIPRAMSVIADPRKTVADKIFSTVFLTTIVSLSIAGFIVGALFAAIAGTVVSAIATALEGIDFLGKIIKKYEASQAFNTKRGFNEYIQLRQIPAHNKFDALFEIRAVELKNIIAKNNLTIEEKDNLLEELTFINNVLKQKKIIIADNQKSLAFMLQELYKKREEQLTLLTDKIALIDSAPDVGLLNEIHKLQNDILETDEQIEKITAPIEKLNIENMIAGEKLALSFSAVSLATAGTLLSILGLMLTLGSIAMPPLLIPAIIGFGIGLAAIGLGKFVIEKIAEHEDSLDLEKKNVAHKEFIMDEALYNYEHQHQSKMSPTPGVSHSKYMQELLTKAQPQKQAKDSPQQPVVIYGHPVFKKTATTEVELSSSPEKTPTDIINPSS